jgi:hypothetical protein
MILNPDKLGQSFLKIFTVEFIALVIIVVLLIIF